MSKHILAALLAAGAIQAGPAAHADQQSLPPGCFPRPSCPTAFTGTAHIDCFGCVSSPGTASLDLSGAVNGHADANYTAFEGTGATCVITGTATGNTTGALNVSFNWTRVGAAAVILTSGDINGAGVAAFVVTSPVGIPCGSPVDALVVGAIAGT